MQFSKIFNGRLLMYLIFWAVSFYVCLELFSRNNEIQLIDVIYAFLFHIPMVFAVTVHSLHHIQNFLAKQRFLVYGFMLFFLVIATFFLYEFTFGPLSKWLFPDFYLVGVFSPAEVLGFTLIYLILSSSLEFSRTWFGEIKARTRVAELETEKTLSELKALRAQVNPHFLFNSLNAIYGESLKGSDKTPKLILQLSDMLRYVLDKMDLDKVPLEEEVTYLKNYIDMQKRRLDHPEKVQFNVVGEIAENEISPLLLINFLENCFKHADLQDVNGFITIDLRVNDGSLELSTRNTILKQIDTLDSGTGLGIGNAQKRLELAYPDAYTLNLSDDGTLYELNLRMNLLA
ncbi:sensor histidine kinase [Balneola sp. MJW-20]|uniref:sensor histidine kinase n=1 Tax=Gracilimonas aurantiaca TaxID=3234185 RepID=UPI003467103D